MKLIKKIEITKFRSIYRESIDLSELTIISGKNNSGKSNVLRALNLFFNGQSSFKQDYDHERDYNKAYTGRVGNKRLIEIRLHFSAQGSGALARDFCISRKFTEEGPSPYEYGYPENLTDITDGNTRRQFTRFLNKIEYLYVPAVRDKDYVKELFLLFEKILEDKKGQRFKEIIKNLSRILEEKSRDVSVDFETFLNLPTRAELSSNIADILSAVQINVESGIKVQRKGGAGRTYPAFVDLFSSGDGVLMSYIPHFLNHVCEQIKNKHFVWGFEEPENSLEYSRADALARKFLSEFSKHAQILVTTHSPAFISLNGDEKSTLYRVYMEPKDPKQTSHITTIKELKDQQLSLLKSERTADAEFILLREELGLVELARQIHTNAEEELKQLRDSVAELTQPVIYTEGNNVEYLKRAKNFFDKSGTYMIKDGGGKDQLKNLFRHFEKNTPPHKVVFVWDPDCKSMVDELNGNDAVSALALEEHSGQQPAGIESLFAEEWFDDATMYTTKMGKLPGEEVRHLKKDAFQKKVLRDATIDDFKSFKKPIETISKFLK